MKFHVFIPNTYGIFYAEMVSWQESEHGKIADNNWMNTQPAAEIWGYRSTYVIAPTLLLSTWSLP